MDLKTYLQGLDGEAREAFAGIVGSTVGHLKNISYGYKPCGEGLAIQIEKHTDGAVRCEELRPDVDWAYLRGTAAPVERAATS